MLQADPVSLMLHILHGIPAPDCEPLQGFDTGVSSGSTSLGFERLSSRNTNLCESMLHALAIGILSAVNLRLSLSASYSE